MMSSEFFSKGTVCCLFKKKKKKARDCFDLNVTAVTIYESY